MRFDITAEVAAANRRAEQRAASTTWSDATDVALEKRVLGAMLCNYPLHACTWDPRCCTDDDGVRRDDALDACVDVELDDFADLRHRAAFKALRDLQARGAIAQPWEVAEEIKRRDRAEERHVASSVSLVFLTEIALTGAKFSRVSLAFACRRLRELAQHRRMA